MRKHVEESVATGRGRRARPWGSVFGRAQARDGAAAAARGGSRVGVAGIGDSRRRGASQWRDQFLAAGQAGLKSRARMLGTTTTVGCRPRSASC